MTPSRPTLLVFTLGAVAERRRRPLVGLRAARLETELRHACLQRLLEAGRDSACRTVVASPDPIEGCPESTRQGGGSFASRLRRAIDAVAVTRSAPLVLVGTDVPDLGRRQIETALSSLARHPDRVVIGPSPDGGLYLLATCLDLRDIVGGVAWQNKGTRRSLKAALRERGIAYLELESLTDLDDPKDLERWLSAKPICHVFDRLRHRLLHSLRQAKARFFPFEIDLFLPAWVEAQAGRAPPL